ncbi:MAG: pentapeptide repeat-containing protein [Paracoccaceae bacterium]
MSEMLKTSDEIVLFGRMVEDMAMTTGTGAARTVDQSQRIIRVYGLTFDAVYYEMTAPVMFVVGEEGKDIDTVAVPGPNPKQVKFYNSLKVWTVKKDGDAARLDIETGKYEDVLLAGLDDGAGGAVSGARVSGARVAGARVSGARVSGARVSGARVSGARVSGARVSGARVSDD